MKRTALTLLATLFISLCMLITTAFAAPDTYIGDAAIYSAVDPGGDRPRPNVLLIVDNSRTTLNSASGQAYSSGTTYPTTPGYIPWAVYAGNNQGTFTKVEISNPTAALANVTCNVAIVKETLIRTGTYSGSGSATAPNLSGGACATGPKGATYALGNYLNYANPVAGATADVYVTHNYTYNKTVITKVKGKEVITIVPTTELRSFMLLKTHTAVAGVGGNQPFVATDQSNWAIQPTARVGDPAWAAGTSYVKPAGTPVGDTQRKIMSNAIELVVDGARNYVNFGLMTYGGNNSGGLLLKDMADLSTDAAFNAFKTALPGPGATDGEPVLSSQTNRPQSESLFDAGYYYGAPYSSITNNARIPTAIRNPCGYNHIILITNGLSNGDGSPKLSVIGDYDGDGYTPENVYGEGSHYLDDIASYLYNEMGIKTHTVLAFQAADALVHKAAIEGHGQFYNAYNAEELAAALTKLLTSIVLEIDTSFVAPVVPASSTNRTISSNRVYLGLFKPQGGKPWLGNLKKYGVSSSLDLLDRAGNPATDVYGDFISSTKSYWGTDASDKIMSIDGTLPLAAGGVAGDGGNVAAGGAGGTLKVKLASGTWTRSLYTRPPGSTSTALTNSQNAFSAANTLITAAVLDVADNTEKGQLINFIHGKDGYDDNVDGDRDEVRPWPFGDILHSKPLVVNYSRFTPAQESDCNINKSMIYVGANDGILHAIKDCNGEEAWGFIPETLLPRLKNLRATEHHYFVDESATAYMHDVDGDGIIETDAGDKVVLIFGLRQGGGLNNLTASGSRGAYYAIDVTNPLAPVWMWKIDSTTTGFGELGETWGQPRLAKVKIGDVSKVVAFFGAGYDNNEDLRYGNNNLFPSTTTVTTDTSAFSSDSGSNSSTGSADQLNPRGRGIYAVEVATLTLDGSNKYQPGFTNSGTKIWGYTNADNATMKYSFPSELTVLDVDGNGFFDRIYVGDTGGQVWRFDISATATTSWTANRIFSTNATSDSDGVGRKIFYKPAVTFVKGIPTIFIGTGDRSHPLNRAVVDRLFMIRDRGQVTADNKSIDHLVNLTSNLLQDANTMIGASTDTSLTTVTGILYNLRLATNYGWYVNLENDGEKVLAAPLVFNKQVFFTTYTSSPDASLDVCQIGNLGTSRLYQLKYETAEAVYNHDTTNDTTLGANERADGTKGAVLRRTDRVKNIGVGIPSGIVTLIDASGKVSLMISSSNRIGNYQAPDAKMISPLYWIKY